MRRLVAVVAAGLVAAPLARGAEPPTRVFRIGILGTMNRPASIEAFTQRLRELGYAEGQNVVLDIRTVQGRMDQFPPAAAELVRLRPDVLVGNSNPAVAALKQATQTIPIVMAVVGDPVGSGFVASLARPGGNITGNSNLAEGLSAKWVELLKETAPRISRVAALVVPATPAHAAMWREIQGTAAALQVTPQAMEVRGPGDIERAFAALSRERNTGLIVLPHPVTVGNLQQILRLTLKARLPVIHAWREFPEGGGLMSYGPSLTDLYRRAAVFVDKILKGAKPAELPVEQPTRFELVVNLKAAKGLGLTIPPSILVRADQVIQ